jgi:hypothetical protein
MRNNLLAILVVGFLVGCASPHKKLIEQEVPKDIVVERNTDRKDRPAWVNETFREEEGTYYFSGGIDRGHDLAMSIRQAKAEALKNMSESVAAKIRQEFTEMAEGDNQNDDLARWVSDGISWVVDNFYVTGVKQKTVYYERVYNTFDAELTYTTFVLLEVRKPDYLRSRRDAIRKIMGYFRAKKMYEAEKRAKELLDKLTEEETV